MKPRRGSEGLVHAYLGYDAKEFPSPTAPPPDVAGAAFEYAMEYGDLEGFTEEQLAAAIRIDASQIEGLGPSLRSLIAMLEARKARILAEYETEAARCTAAKAFAEQAATITVKKEQREDLERAVKQEQMRTLEGLWYAQKSEHSPVARGILALMERLGEKFSIEQLASKYAFTGRTPMTVEEALAVKAELEAIDKLLEQLREAMKTSQLAIIDMDQLDAMARDENREGELERLNEFQKKIEEMVRAEAERQGVERTREGFRLSPKAYSLVRGRLLAAVFSDLKAARSGRHEDRVVGEGAVETAKTKDYEFGDSLANMDVAGSFVNAFVRKSGREAGEDDGGGVFPEARDLLI
ncbi:MAG: hypothetical protein ACOYN0_19360, partial [Phycisphaerales bacterium]